MRRYVVIIHLLVAGRMIRKRWMQCAVSAMAACRQAELEADSLGYELAVADEAHALS